MIIVSGVYDTNVVAAASFFLLMLIKIRVSHVYKGYRVFRSVVVFPACMQNNFRFNISCSCFWKAYTGRIFVLWGWK